MPLDRRTPRRRRARVVAAALAGAALLTGTAACGVMDADTDQVYLSSAGNDHRTGQVDVLAAVVVSAADGSGTFIATFSNNSTDQADTVTEIAPAGVDAPNITVEGFAPIAVEPTAYVNLADHPPGIAVTGEDVVPGGYVTLTFTLEREEQFDMRVPVVAARDFYEGLDTASDADTPATEPTESPS